MNRRIADYANKVDIRVLARANQIAENLLWFPRLHIELDRWRARYRPPQVPSHLKPQVIRRPGLDRLLEL